MELIMPAFAAVIIIFGLIKRVPVFDCFLEGAKEGFLTLYRIAPTILGLVFAVGLLRSSGAIARNTPVTIKISANAAFMNPPLKPFTKQFRLMAALTAPTATAIMPIKTQGAIVMIEK